MGRIRVTPESDIDDDLDGSVLSLGLFPGMYLYLFLNFPLDFFSNLNHIVCSYLKVTKLYSKILLMKSSENDFIFLPAFYMNMCLMKAPKNF